MTPEPLVLAVDDEAGILRLMKLELTAQGFRVSQLDVPVCKSLHGVIGAGGHAVQRRQRRPGTACNCDQYSQYDKYATHPPADRRRQAEQEQRHG